jgi:hypothetical protein
VTYFEPYVQVMGICNLRFGDIRAVHEAFENMSGETKLVSLPDGCERVKTLHGRPW